MINNYLIKRVRGFTLVEMAIVLVILGFVLGALLLPLQAQRQQLAQAQTENTLENAKRALLGFAQQQGRLPCPATNNGTGVFPDDSGAANPLGGTHNITPPNPAVPNCVVQAGFLPAATLGIQPTDAQGFALDAWNNRIRYAVAANNNSAAIVNGTACGGDTAPDFTTTDNLSAVGLACLAPELRVCNSATGITATTCSVAPEVNYSINNAVVVIYSTGATFALGSGSADEDANLNADGVFVSHDPTAASAANGEFDHLVIWISPFVLYNAMIQAGQLH
ncbi:MAG: prepilin-type N-terminal cleavage/methylation domain-containing protein [Methylotenera sp.]